jgi:hypothetical protein
MIYSFIKHEYLVTQYILRRNLDTLIVDGKSYPSTGDFFKVKVNLEEGKCLACSKVRWNKHKRYRLSIQYIQEAAF